MCAIHIVLSLSLKEESHPTAAYYGPIFYNWLPTENDYLMLNTPEPDTTLTVWFERIIKESNSSIASDKRTIVDKLKGKLEINRVTSDLLNIFETNKTQHISYEQFGKKVIKKMIYPTISNLLNILRINYGQYWLAQLSPWNSLDTGLGQYCQMLEMKWSIDGKEWQNFVPTLGARASKKFRIASEPFFEQFILRNDLQEVAQSINTGYTPTVAAILLGRAHQYEDQGDLRSSFIEGISALELAIKEFIQPKLSHSNIVSESMGQFWEMGLKSKVIAITTTLGNIPIEDIENTIKAIDIRNKIAHEGWEPTDKVVSEKILMGLFRTAAGLLSGPKFKFPKIGL